MNNKQIIKQLFETKFIKALYKTELDNSYINRIIAEELLLEVQPSTEDLEKMKAAGLSNDKVKKFSLMDFEDPDDLALTIDSVQDPISGMSPDEAFENFLTNMAPEFNKVEVDSSEVEKRGEKKEKIVQSVSQKKEPDEKLDAITKIFVAFVKQKVSSKEKLADLLMLQNELGVIKDKYKAYLDDGREGYSDEGKEELQDLHEAFLRVFSALDLSADTGADRFTILTKLQRMDDLSEEAIKTTIEKITENFIPVIKRVRSQVSRTKKTDERTVTRDVKRRLNAYSARIDSWISFVDNVKTKATESFKDDLDKRQNAVNLIKNIDEIKTEFEQLKTLIQQSVSDVDEIEAKAQDRSSVIREQEEEFKTLFDTRTTRAALQKNKALEPIFKKIVGDTPGDPNSIEVKIAELSKKFNQIKAISTNPETYKISKGNIEGISDFDFYPPIPNATMDNFLDTLVTLMIYPESDDIPMPSLVDSLRAIKSSFKSKAYTKLRSMMVEELDEDPDRHGMGDLSLTDESEEVAENLEKIVKEHVQEFEPYKEEIVMALIGSESLQMNNEYRDDTLTFNDEESDAFNDYANERDPEERAKLYSNLPFRARLYVDTIGSDKMSMARSNIDPANKGPIDTLGKAARDTGEEAFMFVTDYVALLSQNEGTLKGIQFDILRKVQKGNYNLEILKNLIKLFSNKSPLKHPSLKSFSTGLFKFPKQKDLTESLRKLIHIMLKEYRTHKEP